MPSSRYAPLPNPSSAQDAEQEMADAFNLDDDDEDNSESTPLTRHLPPSPSIEQDSESTALGRRYDFEREYDFPPPGSPPKPTARALPNDFGNSNGMLPSAPVAKPIPRLSLFRRAVGALLPTHYQPVPTEGPSRHTVGGGTENDGVFANVTAKPQPVRTTRTEDGDVHVVPEDNQKEAPPSYLEAQADAVPPYWETTIHAPSHDGSGDLVIEDLPTGSFLIFCLNTFISFFFQFVGFLLTYLLHTSHAAKFGSRAGLGLTLIQYGFYSRMRDEDDAIISANTNATDVWGTPLAPSSSSTLSGTQGAIPPSAPTPNDAALASASKDWLSFIFMTLGWFLLLSSVISYWRIKRWEKSIRAPAVQPTPEQLERDDNLRQRLESVFGLTLEPAPFPGAAAAAGGVAVVQSTPIVQRADLYHNNPNVPQTAEESRLARDLRAAGLL